MQNCQWLEPLIVAQIEFNEWTPDGHLRHPSFVGCGTTKTRGRLDGNESFCSSTPARTRSIVYLAIVDWTNKSKHSIESMADGARSEKGRTMNIHSRRFGTKCWIPPIRRKQAGRNFFKDSKLAFPITYSPRGSTKHPFASHVAMFCGEPLWRRVHPVFFSSDEFSFCLSVSFHPKDEASGNAVGH